MAPQLPFLEASFDAVMSNVALHTFRDTVTRSVFAEVRSLVPPACPCSTSTRSRATRYAAADGQRHVSSN